MKRLCPGRHYRVATPRDTAVAEDRRFPYPPGRTAGVPRRFALNSVCACRLAALFQGVLQLRTRAEQQDTQIIPVDLEFPADLIEGPLFDKNRPQQPLVLRRHPADKPADNRLTFAINDVALR